MLSPTRSASQALLKATVTALNSITTTTATAATNLDEQCQTAKDEEQLEEEQEGPAKKKFKEDDKHQSDLLIGSEALSSAASSSTTEIPDRKTYPKKRKVCVSFGYCGAGYFGLQRNAKDKVHRTIEDELVEAFVKVGAIPQQHADDMSKMGFQRAARTDKGVSAVANLISLKLSPLENLTERVNEILPRQIRMYGVKRVAASFNSKNSCDARTYIYVLPTYAFCPIEEITTESYRITPGTLQLAREIAGEYVGTHNFHNFTSGRKFTDPSSRRHIYSVTLADPYMKEHVEFTTVTIKGQSFMLHQIRKMISLVIAIVRGIASRDTIQLAYNADKIDIPKAPPLGLALNKLHYERYDKKFGNDGQHESLTFAEAESTIAKFKEDVIIPYIVKKEITDKSMFVYLERLLVHTFTAIDPSTEWRQAFPYQIVFQKVKVNCGSSNNGAAAAAVDDDDEESENGGDE